MNNAAKRINKLTISPIATRERRRIRRLNAETLRYIRFLSQHTIKNFSACSAAAGSYCRLL